MVLIEGALCQKVWEALDYITRNKIKMLITLTVTSYDI